MNEYLMFVHFAVVVIEHSTDIQHRLCKTRDIFFVSFHICCAFYDDIISSCRAAKSNELITVISVEEENSV